MKKTLLILALSLFLIGNVSSNTLDGFQNINKLIDEGYSLHSTNVIAPGQYQYNLISNGSEGKHRLITCVYSLEQEVTICWTP